jgi:hypothetical protein
MILKNGVGDGILAEVFPNHHLAVSSISEPIIGYKSRADEQAFTIATPLPLTVGTSARSCIVLYNGETEKNFIVNKLYVSHNGGSTNHNRVVYGTLYKDTDLPTANILGSTSIALGNLNLGSSRVTSVVAYIWDEASTGLDGDKGDLAMNQMFAQGMTQIELSGSLIMSPSQKVRIDITGEEDTEVLLALSGFLEDA